MANSTVCQTLAKTAINLSVNYYYCLDFDCVLFNTIITQLTFGEKKKSFSNGNFAVRF